MMKILLALDPSTQTMDEAIKIATDKQASLTALFVLDTTWNDYTAHDWLSGSGSRADFLEYARDHEFVSETECAATFRKRCPFQCEVKSATGRVSDEITRELIEGEYDLLVMSHPFRRGLEVVRDTAGKILKDITCSVYLVQTNPLHCSAETDLRPSLEAVDL
ncbi:MAG: universal stress protein [Chlorobium sp.]|jgi:nucleotide-binding universal stress UspA family protein|nr:universal stress protein [Chlorobium sp.]